jgi:ketosteroid isomerase-like protein
MLEHRWAGAGDTRFDLLEPRLQLYGDTAIVSYTFMLSRAQSEGGVEHRLHNESRVLIKRDERWQIVHVHKSPAWQAPFESR